jgi:hypothetical protein
MPRAQGMAGGPTIAANGLFGSYVAAVADTSAGRVRVDVYWPGTQNATVDRVDAAGQVTPVRGGDPALMATHWARFDYEAPLDAPVTYQASSPERNGALDTSSAVTLDSDRRYWLKNVTSPYLNVRVRVKDPGDRNLADVRGILRPPERPDPIVVYQARRMDAGSISLYAADTAEEQAIRALLADGGPVLLQYPGYAGGENLYLSVGAVGITSIIPKSADLQRVIVLPFDSHLRTAGQADAGPDDSYADLGQRYSTYNHEAGSRLTYLEISMLG